MNAVRVKRLIIICYAAFMALMLFQTPVMQLGTITAFGTIALTLIVGLLGSRTPLLQRRFKFNPSNVSLILLIIIPSLVSMAQGRMPQYYTRLIGQMILCISLSQWHLREYEHRFLRNIYVCAAVIYAILAIRACYSAGISRYYHGDIEMFGTSFDPNYIGIPLVASSAIILDCIMRAKKRALYITAYTIVLVSIVYTASRGNYLALVLSNSLVFSYFLMDKSVSIIKRILLVLLIVSVIGAAMYIFSTLFPEQWSRMTDISTENDNGRLALWRNAYNAWLKAPLFGIGLQGMYYVQGMASHNTYLQLLSETGVIGLSLFIAFVSTLGRKAYVYDRALFSAFIGMLIQIAFLDAFDNRCVWVLFCWLIMLPPCGNKKTIKQIGILDERQRSWGANDYAR